MVSEGGGDGPVEQHSVFQTRRLLQVIELPLENSDETNVILSFASRCVAKKQFQAFYCADKTLLLRSLEEDLHPRFWRLPWTTALDRMQQQHQSSSLLKLPVDGGVTSQSAASAQHVVALEFAPEGDWLVVIVSWGLRAFLLLTPVASLVTRQRKVSLQNHLRDGASEDLMSITPSAMSTKMMAFLRAHGQNGAKYHSNVAGDDEDVSVLEFAQGMSSPTCVAWWRSFNGHNYVLLGSSADLISIVHVETNNECCRCELSGKIMRIELVHTASTTAMLVETAKSDGATWHFKVLLEMKKPSGIKTFPDHFLEDTAFRPVRIKQFAPTASLHVVRDSDDAAAASTPLLAVCDANAIRFYSNDFKWTPVTACSLPKSLHPSSIDRPNIVVSFCSSQLMLVQVGGDSFNLAVWVSHRPHVLRTDGSQPPKSNDGHDGASMSEGKVVHTLKLREDERVRHTQIGRAMGSTLKEDGTPTMAFFLHTDHQVYECRPKWTRALLFHALYARTIHVEEAVFIGYALGLDMAALCESVADAICADHTTRKMSRNSCEWIMRLYAKSSHVMPSTTLEKMVRHGGLVNAIEYAKEALAPKPPAGGPVDKDRQFLAHTVIESTLKLHHQATKPSETTKDWAWFVSFLSTNADFNTAFAIDRCVWFQCIDAALTVGHARRDVDAALRAVQDLGASLTEAQVDLLLSQHHASNLTAPEARILFRNLPLSDQIKVLLRHPSAVWMQRDWVLRILPDLSDDECAALAAALDPRTVASTAVSSVPYYVPQSDVATSEAIPVTMEEKVELFLTLLLRLNCQRCRSVRTKAVKSDASDTFTQDDLVGLIKAWSKQYRPPVLVLRCVDYTNWAAAAACYEAQGEWVDAIECKLHLHDLQPKPGNDAYRHVITHEELVHLMDTLVFSNAKMAAPMRVAVLARLFMHWHFMKYDIEALEAHVVKQSDLTPVATILFTKAATFDPRDRGWIDQCQTVLPFSGRFYFAVCQRHVRHSQRPASDPAADKSVVDTVLENIQRHHTDLRHVSIQRQTPAALGQTDPIETHAAVFSCGHGFPKRVFDDDVVPLFEKKMAIEFPTIPHTTAVLLAEFRKGGAAPMEAPCPVCAFSRIQRIFATASQTSANKLTREPPRPRIMTSDQWVWK